MKHTVAYLILAAFVAACAGVPLRSMPRLMKLQNELLEMDPAEFMVAIQADARATPPQGAAPMLHIAIRPTEPKAFDAVERKLPMRYSVASADSLGLASPPADRRWLIYSFPPQSQAELKRIQSDFKRIQAERRTNSGASLAVGIEQEGLAAVMDPALADTRWESWLQTSRREGFFELWSGTIAALMKQAKTAKPAQN
jgi:hypothetical protein